MFLPISVTLWQSYLKKNTTAAHTTTRNKQKRSRLGAYLWLVAAIWTRRLFWAFWFAVVMVVNDERVLRRWRVTWYHNLGLHVRGVTVDRRCVRVHARRLLLLLVVSLRKRLAIVHIQRVHGGQQVEVVGRVRTERILIADVVLQVRGHVVQGDGEGVSERRRLSVRRVHGREAAMRRVVRRAVRMELLPVQVRVVLSWRRSLYEQRCRRSVRSTIMNITIKILLPLYQLQLFVKYTTYRMHFSLQHASNNNFRNERNRPPLSRFYSSKTTEKSRSCGQHDTIRYDIVIYVRRIEWSAVDSHAAWLLQRLDSRHSATHNNTGHDRIDLPVEVSCDECGAKLRPSPVLSTPDRAAACDDALGGWLWGAALRRASAMRSMVRDCRGWVVVVAAAYLPLRRWASPAEKTCRELSGWAVSQCCWG